MRCSPSCPCASMLRAHRRSYIPRDVLRRYRASFLEKAPIIAEEGAEMALFNIRGQLIIISHGDCNHPLVIRRIASGPRLSIRNSAIFYPIKKRAGLLPSRKMQFSDPFATSATTTGAGNRPIVPQA